MLRLSENSALVLRELCSGSQRTYPILLQADPLIKQGLDKYFKDHNQRGGGKWRMYHTDETSFYQPDDSKMTATATSSSTSSPLQLNVVVGKIRAEPRAPQRRNDTKMEALVAIKWVNEMKGQVCKKATEDLQNLFCLSAIHLVSLF